MANLWNGDINKLVCLSYIFNGKEGGPGGLRPDKGTENIAPDTLIRLG